MKTAKDATVCVVDTGIFTHITESLVGQFKRVLFYNPCWKTAFPSSNQLFIGEGLKGVERIEDFWDHFNEVDLYVFPDGGQGDLQDELLRRGKFVWGSRRADELELNRWEFSQTVLKDLDMPVPPMVRILGTKKLREYFNDPKNVGKYVKVSQTRNDMESRQNVGSAVSELWLNEFEHNLGPLAHDAEFIVEEEIPTFGELGYDGFDVDGKYPAMAMHGLEMKDTGFFACAMPYAQMPEPIRYVNTKFAPVLKAYGHRGNFSTEIRVGKDKKIYFRDPTIRFGCPPSQIQVEMITNLGEIMWNGAQGVLIEPKFAAKYGVQAFIYSHRCDKEWMCYLIEKGYEQWFKFSFKCVIEGKTYTVPQHCEMPNMGSVVAIADDPMTAIKRLVEYSGKIKSDGISIRLDSIPRAIKAVHEANAKGYKFGSGFIPSVEAIAKIVT